MFAPLVSLLMLLHPGSAGDSTPATRAETLHCQVKATAEGKRRCSVPIPEGRTIQPCTGADASAGRCDPAGEGQYLAWVVASSDAKCKISRKRTQWTRKVTLSMSSKTAVGPATCDLYVVLK